MNDPWSITITPIPKTEDCTIRTSDGQEFTVRGLAVFADGGDGQAFSFFWNSPLSAAKGCVKALAAAIQRGDDFAVSFYNCIFRMFALCTGNEKRNVVSPEDLLRRWDAEDVYKVGQEDPKKFN